MTRLVFSPVLLLFTIHSVFALGAGTLRSFIPVQQQTRSFEKRQAAALPAQTIFQFDQPGTWIENVVARSNGDLLFTTVLPSPQLYLLQDVPSGKPRARLIFAPNNVTGLHGITETSPDHFVVFGGNVTNTGQGVPDSFSAWEVFVNDPDPSKTVIGVRHITKIPKAGFLNGAAAMPDSSIVLACDSVLGAIFRLDTQTGATSVIMQSTNMVPIQGVTPQIGVNGIKIRNGSVYFDNSASKTIFRMQLLPNGTVSRRDRTVNIAKPAVAPFLDDFDFGPDGSIFAATNFGNTVVQIPQASRLSGVGARDITADGITFGGGGGGNRGNATRTDNSRIVAGSASEMTVAGATAVAFGRGPQNKQVLYVVTSGALGSPVNGSITEPAKVVAIDMSFTRR